MAVAFDATLNHSGSAVATTGTITISTVNLVIGQAVILFIAGNDASVTFTVASVVDSGGTNKYVKLTSVVNSIRSFMECWVCTSVTATVTTGSFTVTWTGGVGPAHSAASYVQYSGMLELGGYLSGTQASATALTQTKVTQGANSMIVCGFGNQGLGTHTAGTATNLRVSNTTAGTATTAEGIASCDSTNTTAASGTSLAVAQTLGTAGISSNIILELSPNFTWVGDSETVDDVPSFNITLKQGFNTPSTILEPDLGDIPDAWPIVPAAIFLAPMYSDTVTNEELPGFDTTKSRGFLSLAIAEVSVGDNPALPPLVFAIGQTTLMGYRGYRVSQRILAMEQDYGPDLLPIVTTVFNDWTTDAERQLPWQVNAIEDDVSDAGVERIAPAVVFNDWTTDAENQLPWWANAIEDDVSEPEADRTPDLLSWTDVILMGWRGYRTSPSLMLQSDDGVELVQAAAIIYNDLTTDAENQKFQAPYYLDAIEDRAALVQIALTTGWDTDADNQRSMPLPFSFDDVADAAVERVQIALTTGWDTDAEQQRAQPLPFGADDVADSGVEQITLPYNDFSTDADAQMDRSWRFGADQGLDEQVERIQIALTTGWDTDADQQRAMPLPFSADDVADAGVERVQIALTTGWDTDAEQQLNRTVQFSYDDVLDAAVEYITLPANVWDTDADEQLPISPYVGLPSDGGQDWTQLIITPAVVSQLYAWDTDAEYQLDRSWRVGDDVADAGVEYITLPFEDWSELPQQTVTAAIRDFASEDALLTTTPLAYDLDLENQLSQSAWTPDRALSDEGVERVSIALTTGWDTDAEQQLNRTVQFSYDDVLDAAVEYITLPANVWDTDADQQLSRAVQFSSDDLADAVVERVQIALTTGWDTDAEQQLNRTVQFSYDDVLDAAVEYITLPANVWDTDADQQLSRAVQFSSDDLADAATEYITLPANIWDTDADEQLAKLPYVGLPSDGGADWTQYIIVPPVVFALNAWDSDAEQQMDRSWRVGDDVADAGVEYITLPPEDWSEADQHPAVVIVRDAALEDTFFISTPVAYDLDLENQLRQVDWNVDRAVSDDAVERVQIALTTGWDTDAENQRPMPLPFAASEVMDAAVELVQIALTTGWDTDAENQRPMPLRFSADTVADETIERITLNAGVAVALDDLMSAYPAGRFGYTPFAVADEGALQFLNAISRLLISQYEAKATVAAVVQYGNYEGLAGLSKTLATNYEGVAALARALASNYESLATLRRQLLSEYEAFKGLTAANVNQYEALTLVTALRRSNYEALASVMESLLSQYEALGFTTITQTLLSQYEALLGATAVLKSQYEAERALMIVQGSNYEALVSLLADYLSNYECTGFRAGIIFPIMSRLGRSASPYACSDDATASGTGASGTAAASAAGKTDACSEDSESGTKSVDSDSNTCPD